MMKHYDNYDIYCNYAGWLRYYDDMISNPLPNTLHSEAGRHLKERSRLEEKINTEFTKEEIVQFKLMSNE